MGFLENVLKKIGASLATRYGVIQSGKYKDCKIALGNPPKEKVTTAYSFSQMIILNENEEVARLSIANDIEDVEYIETIKFATTGNKGYRCKITFADGNTCEADLFPSKLRIFYMNLNGNMLKETREFFEQEIEDSSQI